MERQVKSQSPSGISGVFKEAFKTTIRNGKLVVLILLIVFLSLSQLELGSSLALAPLLKDLSSQWAKVNQGTFQGTSSQWANRDTIQSVSYIDETSQTGVRKDVREVLAVNFLTLALSCVILLFFSVATISSSYEAHTAKVLSTKDMLLKMRGSWKRPIITNFYMSLISLGVITLYIISTGVISILAGASSIAYLLYTIEFISILVCYFYMVSLWMISLVVSVLEDGLSGVKAIDRAGELMKGKRVQASVIMLLFKIAFGAVYIASLVLTGNLGKWARLAIAIPVTVGLSCLLKLFMFVVYTVFYHECRMNQKEEGVKAQVGLYVPVASDEV